MSGKTVHRYPTSVNERINSSVIRITRKINEFDSCCESEIERLMYSAFATMEVCGLPGYCEKVIVHNEYDGSLRIEENDIAWIINSVTELDAFDDHSIQIIVHVLPQFSIFRYRTDFLCVASYFDVERHDSSKALKTELLVVECDGHDFHEKTKFQAKRDKKRDRDLLAAGLPVMRFTGSEIWNDAYGCCEKITGYFGEFLPVAEGINGESLTIRDCRRLGWYGSSQK
jgi:very-short-patch-repair endonuclease